jgi:aspartyl-tRNA(Asn)/glutamyl-tRNA(Gln) amidotransferase subunit A
MYRLSAKEIRERFLQKKNSAVEIATYFLDRATVLDSKINSFLSLLSHRMLHKAEELDRKLKEGKPLGKLAAVPVGIKDNTHIKGEITTCASRFLSHYRAPFDATVVELLEQEDALLIGKLNLDEFAMGSSTEFSAYQVTHNPWDLNCSPGGSSGGSAAAVAARLCPLSTGSDTGGSIRQPAAFCGVVGFKPTYGRVSRNGLVAFASSLDQIGPFAYNVEDIALMMDVIGKHCPKDSMSIPGPAPSYLEALNQPIAGKKVGVPWHFLEDLNQESKDNFLESIELLKSLGAEVVEVNLDILKYSIAVYYVLATAEASTNLARFDGVLHGNRSPLAQTLDEVYDLSKQEGFGPEVKNRILLGTYVLSSGYQDEYYTKAQKVRSLIIEHYRRAFAQCDIIAMPVSPFPAYLLSSIRDPLQMYLQDIYTVSVNLAGLPAVSVPSGFSDKKRPFGFQLIGAQMNDVEVLTFAHAFEKKCKHSQKIPPLFDYGGNL